MLHVLAQRGFKLLLTEADLLSGVAGISWHCPSAPDLDTLSRLFLAQTSNQYVWDGMLSHTLSLLNLIPPSPFISNLNPYQ